MKRSSILLGQTALLLIASSTAAIAQSPTTGSFIGKVTDGNGSPVEGAKVILTGPALQGSRTAITGADGSYRIPFIPSGNGYIAKAVAPSGSFQSKNLTLAPWQNFTLNFIVRKAEEASAVVEVLATQSVIAIDTTTVTDAHTITTEALQSLPVFSRDYSAAVYLSPGVVDGGRGTANPNIAGGTAFENNYLVDGQNVTDPRYGQNKTKINTLAIESIQVQGGGYEPEYGRATGGIISVVTKTGSNEFQTDFEATFRPKSTIAAASAQSVLPFNAARDEQGNQTDVAFWTGGPVIKDRLWYSFGLSQSSSATDRTYGQVYLWLYHR